MKVSAYFQGESGSTLDKAAHSILKGRGGEFVGSGTMLETGERDVQYEFPDSRSAQAAASALKSAGYRMKTGA